MERSPQRAAAATSSLRMWVRTPTSSCCLARGSRGVPRHGGPMQLAVSTGLRVALFDPARVVATGSSRTVTSRAQPPSSRPGCERRRREISRLGRLPKSVTGARILHCDRHVIRSENSGAFSRPESSAPHCRSNCLSHQSLLVLRYGRSIRRPRRSPASALRISVSRCRGLLKTERVRSSYRYSSAYSLEQGLPRPVPGEARGLQHIGLRCGNRPGTISGDSHRLVT